MYIYSCTRVLSHSKASAPQNLNIVLKWHFFVNFQRVIFKDFFACLLQRISTSTLSPYLSALDFVKFQFEILSLMNLSYATCVTCKIQVVSRLKIKFIKLDISKYIAWEILVMIGKRILAVPENCFHILNQTSWILVIWII